MGHWKPEPHEIKNKIELILTVEHHHAGIAKQNDQRNGLIFKQ